MANNDLVDDREKTCLIVIIVIAGVSAILAFVFFDVGSETIRETKAKEDSWKKGNCNVTDCSFFNKSVCSFDRNEICNFYSLTLFLHSRDCSKGNTSYIGTIILETLKKESDLQDSKIDCWYSCSNVTGTLTVDLKSVPVYSYYTGNLFCYLAIVAFVSVFAIPCLTLGIRYLISTLRSKLNKEEDQPLIQSVEPM